jgi:hypothetical protein
MQTGKRHEEHHRLWGQMSQSALGAFDILTSNYSTDISHEGYND